MIEISDLPTKTGILTADSISVRFGGVAALSDVTLTANRGEICGLIGPNGAGKTTLFDVLSGIQRGNSGEITLDGKDITSRSATWRARHGIRRTFQRQQLFGWLSVEENVLTALEWRGGGGGFLADLTAFPTRRKRERERRLRAADVIQRCGLERVRDQPAARLPIGAARMVEVARAIVDHPAVLLLDEPTSGLEPADTEKLGEILQHVRAEDGCAVMLIEHDVRFVMGQCDRIVVLHLGRVIASGSPDEIQKNDEARAAYLG